MVDKAFYSQATEEVAAGQMDQALWIKICTEHAHEAPVMRQAKYIQQRARDIAGEAKVNQVKRAVPRVKRRVLQLFALVVLLGVIAMTVSYIYFIRDQLRSDYSTITFYPVLYSDAIGGLADAQKSRDRWYQLEQQGAGSYELKDGTTVHENLDTARRDINWHGGQAFEDGQKIRLACGGLNTLRKDFIGALMDPTIRDRRADSICQLWVSDAAPDRNLYW